MNNGLSMVLPAAGSVPATAALRGPALGIQHNIFLSRFEAYVSGRMAGYIRYSMRGSEMWLLYTQATDLPAAPTLSEDLIHAVLVDAGRRRVAVHPYCPAVRSYMRSHPHYLDLVPRERRARFRLPPAHPIYLAQAQNALSVKDQAQQAKTEAQRGMDPTLLKTVRTASKSPIQGGTSAGHPHTPRTNSGPDYEQGE